MMVASSGDGQQVMVGSRVESEGCHATVKFIGEVPPTKGVWLGVEWDDPSRGKHDGSKDGQRYFTTRHPTSGSFLRAKKVNAGASFMAELRDRYGRIEDESAGVIEEEMYVRGNTGQLTTVEVVGAQKVNLKQSQFSQLREVSLRATNICGLSDEEDIKRNLPNLSHLDISLNLFPSWEVIANIAGQLPKLKWLDVSENMVTFPEHPEELQRSFKGCQTLFLNRMTYNWDKVLQCCLMFPSLKELHLCFNCIDVINRTESLLHNLTLLNLESNPIKDWESILQLGSLSSLQTLILNGCGLDSVFFPDVPFNCTTSHFPSLASISLSHNNIKELRTFDELNKLGRLTEVMFKKNPLMTGSNDADIRSTITAKLSNIKLLNRTEITAVERMGSELDYLKQYGQLWRSSGGHQDPAKNKPSSEFNDLHPCFQILIEKYGAPEDAELKKYSSALKNNLITVTVDCPEQPDKAAVTKKIPNSMTVQRLKALLRRVYKVDPINMTLTYTSLQMEDQVIEMDNDQKEISFFSIEDGDAIHVKLNTR